MSFRTLSEGLLPLHREVSADFGLAISGLLKRHGIEGDEKALRAVVVSSRPQFGDYQCNNAMSLCKQYGGVLGVKSPREVGAMIAEELEALKTGRYSKVNVAPAGFVTVAFAPAWLAERVRKHILSGGSGDLIEMKVKERDAFVGVDFSSPNIAKEMHVGHLRSTIHGETLCRVLEHVGFKVDRVNHLGDWGTQFGMLIEYLKEKYPEDFTKSESVPALGDLNQFYRESKARFDNDEAFKERARRMVVTLQSGDPDALRGWRMLVDISMNEFEKVYKRLGVRLSNRGESFYNDMLPEIVRLCKEAGFVDSTSGAQCIFEELDPEKRKPNDIPLMLVKSDGGYGYDSTDIAAVYHKLKVMNYRWFAYITDKGQEEHFLKVFNFAKRIGWYDESKHCLEHFGLGLVCGDDGKKFKTRSGDVVRLVDLLDEAVARAKVEIQARKAQKNETEGADVDEDEEALNHAAEAIGYAAVRYFDMSQVRMGNYKFSYEKMLDPKGNTAVYLLYAYARLCAIFRKDGEPEASTPEALEIVEECERRLIVQLLALPDAVEAVLDGMNNHRLCDYAYETCVLFSEFYQQCRIIGSPSRLQIAAATKKCLETVFHLLGIVPLEQI